MLIKLGLPPAELWPNARPHRMAKARAVKTYRHEAAIAAKQALGRARPPRWAAATVVATFAFTTDRRRDPDNCLAALKAAFDGLRDAGVIADDNQLTHQPVAIRVWPGQGYVALEVAETTTEVQTSTDPVSFRGRRP